MKWEETNKNYSWRLCGNGSAFVYAMLFKCVRTEGYELDVWDYGADRFDTVANLLTLEEGKSIGELLVNLRRSEYDAVQ